jgi:saccharopine dehydrogenase-like NADP-dependent oxidoreductase
MNPARYTGFMIRVLLLGAGKIGCAIARLLADSGAYQVRLADVNERALARLAGRPGIETMRVDVGDDASLRAAVDSMQAVVSALSFHANPRVAAAALAAGASYFDLTEDVETTRAVRACADQAKLGQIFMPQCGLAPGFINIMAHDLAKGFDDLDEVRLRVGALAQFPTGELKYNLTWSTDGLINEYCNPCEAIVDGKVVEVQALEGLEHFSLDGVDYEAFNTSGGLGTLWETFGGRVRNLDYKTVRYRGHRDLMHFLIRELRMNEQRDQLKEILERSVPGTQQDVILIFAVVTGHRDGVFTQVSDARKIYHAERDDGIWSGIQITTAHSICAVLDMHVAGQLPKQGFVRQEDVTLSDFLANRFGAVYRTHAQPASSL